MARTKQAPTKGAVPAPTLNVVPAGFKWSVETAQKAAEKRKFIRVGGKTTTTRVLSGAKRTSWSSKDPAEKDTIFSITFRITGTPDNIRRALEYAGYEEEDIENAIGDAITEENYLTTKKKEWDEEIAGHSNAKDNKEQPTYALDDVIYFAENIKEAKIVTSKGTTKGAASPRAKKGDTLSEKYNKLPEDKVIDVSNMDINTGKGAIQSTRVRASKAGKFGSDAINVVSNDVEKYRKALQLIFGEDADIEDHVTIVAKLLKEASKAKTPTKAKAKAKTPTKAKAKAKTPTKAPKAPGIKVPGSSLSSTKSKLVPVASPEATVPLLVSPKVKPKTKVATFGNVGGLAKIPPMNN